GGAGDANQPRPSAPPGSGHRRDCRRVRTVAEPAAARRRGAASLLRGLRALRRGPPEGTRATGEGRRQPGKPRTPMSEQASEISRPLELQPLESRPMESKPLELRDDGSEAAPAASRPGVIQLSIKEKAALYAAYM